jgi:hypothetical protein
MPYKDPEKQRAAQRQSHERLREQRREAARARKEVIKQQIRDIKESTPCADCNEHYPFYVMQFDHVRGVKEGDISKFVSNRQIKKALDEIEKCEVVCANCHMARSYRRQPKGEEHPRFVF